MNNISQISQTNQINETSCEDLDILYGRIQLCITHHCQLKCKYCSLDNGKKYEHNQSIMSSEISKKCIDFTLGILPNTVKKLIITYTSNGEPLLNWKTIDETIKYCQTIDTNISFSHSFATNAVLLNESIIDWIIKNDNLRIFISLDGYQETHNQLRPFKNGEKSFSTVINNIRNYRQKIVSYSEKKLIGSTVLTSFNSNFVEILQFLVSEGFDALVMRPLRGPKEWNYALNENTIEEFKIGFQNLNDFLKQQITKEDLKYFFVLSPAYDFLMKGFYAILLDEKRYFYCPHCPPFIKSLWNFSITFDSDGEIVSPCRDLIGYSDYVIGHIKTGLKEGKKEQIANKNVDNREICNLCSDKYLCGGGCFLNNHYNTKSSVIPDPVMCELTRYVFNLNRNLISFIQETKPDLIEHIKDFGKHNVPWRDYYKTNILH